MVDLPYPHTRGNKMNKNRDKINKQHNDKRRADLRANKSSPSADNTPSRMGVFAESSDVLARGKKANPAKIRYRQKRLCLKLVERLGNMDPATMSDREKSSLSWAKGVLENLDAGVSKRVSDKQDTMATDQQPTPKRQRSPDEKPSAKRSKTFGVPASKSFSEVVKGNRVMAIINRGDEGGSIPRGQWRWIEAKLNEVYVQVLREMPGSPPSCDDAGWYQGRIKLISFEDDRSVALYRAAISKVGEVFPGAQLDMVQRNDIPSRPRAHTWIPSIPADAEGVLSMLRNCNPELPTANWKIGRLGEADGPRREAVVLLNAETLPLLSRVQGRVRYGFGKVELKVYKSDLKAVPNECNSTETTNATENSVANKSSVGEEVAKKDSDGAKPVRTESNPTASTNATRISVANMSPADKEEAEKAFAKSESTKAIDATRISHAEMAPDGEDLAERVSSVSNPPTVPMDDGGGATSDAVRLGYTSGLSSSGLGDDHLLDSEDEADITVVEVEDVINDENPAD